MLQGGLAAVLVGEVDHLRGPGGVDLEDRVDRGGELVDLGRRALLLATVVKLGAQERQGEVAVELADDEEPQGEVGTSLARLTPPVDLVEAFALSAADIFYRYATEDIELGGETIREGSTVVVSLLAANRDPQRFDDPDALDVHRKACGHLSFGHASTNASASSWPASRCAPVSTRCCAASRPSTTR